MNTNIINNNYFKSNNLPLIKEGNKIRITKINEFIFICRIMSLMMFLPGFILVLTLCVKNHQLGDFLLSIIIIIGMTIVACLGFGVSQTLVFDLDRKQLYLEKKFISKITSETLCDFKNINLIGITSYKEIYYNKGGKRIIPKTRIILATKYKPLDFIEVLNANFISYTITAAKLTMIAKIMVVITGCTNFIDGGEENEIRAERNYKTKEVEYELSPAPTREPKLFS